MTLAGFSIRYKLYFGFWIVACVLIAVSALAMLRFNDVRTTLNEVIRVHQPSIIALKDAGIALEQAAGALGYFVITGDAELQQRLNQQLATAKQELQRAENSIGDAAPADMLRLLGQLREQVEQAVAVATEVLSTTSSFEANYPGIAYANDQINPITRDLVQLSSDMMRVHESSGDPALLLTMAELRYAVSNVMRGIRGYLAFRNEAEIDNNQLYLERIQSQIAELESQAMAISFEQADYLDRFVQTFERFNEVYPELLRLHGSERWKQDAWLVRNQVMPLLEQASADMRALSAAQQQFIDDASADLLTSARRTSLWVLGLTIAGVLITALVGWTLARMIARPIRAASHAMAQIAGGDGDLTRRLANQTGDELGELVANFNAFAERIHELVKATARSTNAVISSVAITNENASRIAGRVVAQHRDADRLAEEIRTMVDAIAESAELATEGSASAASAVHDAMNGREIVEQTASGIQELGQHLDAAAEAIAALNQDSQSIGGVLDVISGIAEQTNLLALNAAIEAARAGDSGRGFAVVASEVRSLANRTRESTSEIAEMIVRLQTSAQSTQSRMADGYEMARHSVTHSEQALSALNSIADTIERLRASNETIAAAAARQRESVEHIRQTVEGVSESSRKTAQEAEQTNDAAASLGDSAAELQALIGKFKLAATDALDFEAAKSAHLAWRARIRSFLDGRGSLKSSEALSHRECVLGRWYYGPGLEQYGHLDGMRDLEPPHAKLHSLIGEIIQHKNQGDSEAAEDKYGELIGLSEQIIQRLDDLEETLNSQPRPAAVPG